MNTGSGFFSLVVIIALLTACVGGGGGGSTSSAPKSHTYSTTSSRGDYSEWTLSGDLLDAVWYSVTDAGDVAYTTTIAATCGAEDAFGVHTCTVDTSDCVDGIFSCPTSTPTDLYVREVPGVALYVQVAGDTQLHVGFAKDSTACSQDVSGDYTMIRTGLGLNEMFGMVQTDSNFINILHSDFGFYSSAVTDTPTVTYRTVTESEAIADEGCTDGVRSRRLGSGDLVRSMITHSGLFVLDLPAGQGGEIGFTVANAASLVDFSGKSFGGISFPDSGPPQFINAEIGTVSSGLVTMAVTFDTGESGSMNLMPLTTPSSVTNPGYPDFSVVPTGYDMSTLAGSFPSPASIPGMFKVDVPIDTGRVVLAAMKFHGKVIAVGVGYNWRDAGSAFPYSGLFNTGNFILFEK